MLIFIYYFYNQADNASPSSASPTQIQTETKTESPKIEMLASFSFFLFFFFSFFFFSFFLFFFFSFSFFSFSYNLLYQIKYYSEQSPLDSPIELLSGTDAIAPKLSHPTTSRPKKASSRPRNGSTAASAPVNVYNFFLLSFR